MALETGVFISDLIATNPTSTDPKSQGDDHFRLLKSTIKTTFPNVTGAVNPTQVEFNYLVGVTSLIQPQIAAKGAIAGQTWTGTHAFAATTTIGTVSATEIAYLSGVTSGIQAQINTKGAITGQTWTGSHVFPSSTTIGTVTATEITFLSGVTSAIQTQFTGKAPLASPALTGIPTAPTATVGTATTQIATTSFVSSTAMNAALPGQTGNSGNILSTDGTNAAFRSMVQFPEYWIGV